MIYVCRESSTHMSERGVMRRQNFVIETLNICVYTLNI